MDDATEQSRFRMSAAADRRAMYKAPGGRDGRMSQEARRMQALEEQRKRRLQRVDESRQLDMFADLNLGDSDDEDDEDDNTATHEPQIVREGVAQFAVMLQASGPSNTPQKSTNHPLSSETKQKSKSKPKRRKRRKSKWADKCMYAELLEMNEDVLLEPLFSEVHGQHMVTPPTASSELLSTTPNDPGNVGLNYPTQSNVFASTHEHEHVLLDNDHGPATDTDPLPIPRIGRHRLDDGIPEDLESAWVALAPVPAGKRCLAVTMKGAGWRGVGGTPNTFLRARLTGQPLRPPLGPQQPFPTALPPNTILDCILDKNWKSNGVLHVLDVIRWKGVDLGGCGAGLRFWWRDTRLSELVQLAPPSHSATQVPHISQNTQQTNPQYVFSYPTTIVSVPYITPTPYETLLHDVIPRVRRPTGIKVRIPTLPGAGLGVPSPVAEEVTSITPDTIDAEMQVDIPSPTIIFKPQTPPSPLQDVDAPVIHDGVLLYLTEAAYTSGTGPLSAWIPLRSYGNPGGGKEDDVMMETSPIDLFERLLQRRIQLRQMYGDLQSGNVPQPNVTVGDTIDGMET